MIRNTKRIYLLLACALLANTMSFAAPTTAEDVGRHYVQLAHSIFTDALETAVHLDKALDEFISNPNATTHNRAKSAWITAHTAYSQTEVFRFGNPNVDDWEGKVNAWPMDEGLLDYVHADYQYEDGNPHANENIIASNTTIDAELVETMHEKAGSEANVASGYHAIEFLLWGQDLNADKTAAGTRPYTDYLQSEECTNAPCDRRAQYLKVTSALLLRDLEQMLAQWHPQNGSYVKVFTQLPENEQVNRILLGIGGLSFGELAAERIRVALIANSQEDEQSCFSDTTDMAILSNTIAIKNIYLGEYETIQGTLIEGPSLSDLVGNLNSELNQALIDQLESSVGTANEISQFARNGEPFDQQILRGNKQGKMRLEKLIDQLRIQTVTIEKVAELIVASS